jgi:hypothetical protein
MQVETVYQMKVMKMWRKNPIWMNKEVLNKFFQAIKQLLHLNQRQFFFKVSNNCDK